MEWTTLIAVACIQASFSQLAFAQRHWDSSSRFNCWCNCGEDLRKEDLCTNAPPEEALEEVTEVVVVEEVPEEEEVVEDMSKEVVGEKRKDEELKMEETGESVEYSSTPISTEVNHLLLLNKLSEPRRRVCEHRRPCMCCSCCDRYVEETTECEIDYGHHCNGCDEKRHPSGHFAEDCVKERIRYRPLIYLAYGFDYLLYPPMVYRHFRPCCHFMTHHQ